MRAVVAHGVDMSIRTPVHVTASGVCLAMVPIDNLKSEILSETPHKRLWLQVRTGIT